MSRQPKAPLMVVSLVVIGIAVAFVANATLTPKGNGNALLAFHLPRVLAAADGQALFEQKCKVCHSIGGGDGVGPDLKGVSARRDRDWIVRVIATPDELIAQGDPIATQLVQQYGLPMPNLGVTDDDARAILAYIDAQSTGGEPGPTPAQPATTPTASTSVTTSAAAGRDLFAGKLAFKNGGPSCISCHNVSSVGLLGGGTVGRDLTTAYSNFGEMAIGSMLKTTPFPMMKEVYTTKPLTNEEIGSVLAFLKDAANAPPTSSQNPVLFFIIGGVGAVVVIGLFQFLWRGRLAGVRRPLVKGGSK